MKLTTFLAKAVLALNASVAVAAEAPARKRVHDQEVKPMQDEANPPCERVKERRNPSAAPRGVLTAVEGTGCRS